MLVPSDQKTQLSDIIFATFAVSGDLLQHFLTVIFDKLDKGESWDDDFELNTILQV